MLITVCAATLQYTPAMRHTDLTVDVTRTAWLDTDQAPRQPCLTIQYDGPTASLKDAFRHPDETGYTPDQLDIFYRQQSSPHAADTGGTVSITDRITGDYLLEVSAASDLVDRLVYAARTYADSVGTRSQYVVALRTADQSIASFEKQTLLVYDADGVLLRECSLIPNSVEI